MARKIDDEQWIAEAIATADRLKIPGTAGRVEVQRSFAEAGQRLSLHESATIAGRRKAAADAAYIERVVDDAPPLTAAQWDRLAALLRPAGYDEAGPAA